MKSLNRNLVAIAGLVAFGLVVALAGFLLAVSPQKAKAKSLDDQIATAQAQYAALHTAGSRTPALRAAELFQLSRAMPDSDDMPGILLEVTRLAGESSVKLMGFRPSPRIALTNGSSAVPLNVTVQATWPHLATFLRRVREQVQVSGPSFSVGGRLFDIDTIQIAGGDGPGPMDVTLAMSAFDYGAPPSPTATAGGPGGSTTTTGTTTTTSGAQQAAGAPGGGA